MHHSCCPSSVHQYSFISFVAVFNAFCFIAVYIIVFAWSHVQTCEGRYTHRHLIPAAVHISILYTRFLFYLFIIIIYLIHLIF